MIAGGLDLKLSKSSVKVIAHSSTAKKNVVFSITYKTPTGNQTIMATEDQLFVVHSGSKYVLQRARELEPYTRLVTGDKKDVPIQRIAVGNYSGEMYAISANTAKPDNNFSEHIIVVGGLLLGDYAACLYTH